MSKAITNVFISIRGIEKTHSIQVIKQMNNGDLVHTEKEIGEILEEYYHFRKEMQDENP